jgi:hypothetical protein
VALAAVVLAVLVALVLAAVVLVLAAVRAAPLLLLASAAAGAGRDGGLDWPLTNTRVTSAVPCTSMSTEAELILPVGTGTWFPPAAIVAALNVHVAAPFAFTTGATLLQPRK